MSTEHSEGTDNTKSGSRLRMHTSSLLLSCLGCFPTSDWLRFRLRIQSGPDYHQALRHLSFQQFPHQPREPLGLLYRPFQHVWQQLHRRGFVALRFWTSLSPGWFRCFHSLSIQPSYNSCTLVACYGFIIPQLCGRCIFFRCIVRLYLYNRHIIVARETRYREGLTTMQEHQLSYQEKLRDPRWQRKRLEILERDQWTCQRCHSTTKTLHVHHRIYRHGLEPWEIDTDL